MFALKKDTAQKFQFAGRSGTVYEVPCLQAWPLELLQGLGQNADGGEVSAVQLCRQFRKIIEHYNPSFAGENASDLEVLALSKALQDESAVDLGELLERRAL